MKKEQFIIARVADKMKKYQKENTITYTNFLDPLEIMEVSNLVDKVPNCFFGGYEKAERKILVIGAETEEEVREFLKIVTIEGGKPLSHREVLGSILGLGMSRDVIGDILLSQNRADVFVTKDIASYILQQLKSVGKEKVKTYENTYEGLVIPPENAKEIKTTVASLRVDAIISAGFGVSREVSSKLIQNQKVKWNYQLLENVSKQVKVGDMISVRGYGRLELLSVLGETKKDRIRVILKKV